MAHFIKLLLGKKFVAVFKIILSIVDFNICSLNINHFTGIIWDGLGCSFRKIVQK